MAEIPLKCSLLANDEAASSQNLQLVLVALTELCLQRVTAVNLCGPTASTTASLSVSRSTFAPDVSMSAPSPYTIEQFINKVVAAFGGRRVDHKVHDKGGIVVWPLDADAELNLMMMKEDLFEDGNLVAIDVSEETPYLIAMGNLDSNGEFVSAKIFLQRPL